MAAKRVMIPATIAVILAIVTAIAIGANGDRRARVDVLDRSGSVVGWAYEDELAPPMPSLADARDNFDMGARVAVHGSNDKVVGHIVRGTGFVPLDPPSR